MQGPGWLARQGQGTGWPNGEQGGAIGGHEVAGNRTAATVKPFCDRSAACGG